MKIKIAHPGQDKTREPLGEDFIPQTLDNIQKIEDSICTELYVGNILDYYANRQDLLVMLIKKVRYNGIIIINGDDLYDIVQKFYLGKITNEQANAMFFSGKQSLDTPEHLSKLIKMYGYTVDIINIENGKYSIQARRPEYVSNS